MKKVIGYVRVSTEEQAQRGNSLVFQEQAITTFCRMRGFDLTMIFREDHSAKTFERPEWKKLTEYCRKHKAQIDYVLTLRWDRFSRSLKGALIELEYFKKLKIEINTVEQWLDFNVRESLMMLSMYLGTGEVENGKNSDRTTESSRQARLNGCWTGTAPFGYSNHRTANGKSSLIANEKAQLVIKAFHAVISNGKSVDAIRQELKPEGMKLSKQSFLNMLRNVVYKGEIFVAKWKDHPQQIVKGLHEGIIDEETFRSVQYILSGKRKAVTPANTGNATFPLRGHLLCPVCSKPLTGAFSKGRKYRYPYYKCQNNCVPSVPATEANNEFLSFLKSMNIKPEICEIFQLAVKEILRADEGDVEVAIAKCNRQLEDLEEGLKKLHQKYFVDGMITDEQFTQAHTLFTKQIEDIKEQKLTLSKRDHDLMQFVKEGLPFLSNLDHYYDAAPVELKKQIVGSIFPEKLFLEQKKYRTTSQNEIFALLTNIDAVSHEKATKKATRKRDLSSLAPPSGLEPETL